MIPENSVFSALSHLDKEQGRQVEKLVQLCRSHDHSSLSCPVNEEECTYFLQYKNKSLIALLCICTYHEAEHECIAFTAPQWRKQGYFSLLFSYALAYLQSKSAGGKKLRLLFNIESREDAASHILHKMGARHMNTEYMLLLPLKKVQPVSCKSYDIRKASRFSTLYQYSIFWEGARIGSFCVFALSEEMYYFHSFHLFKKYRGKGHGKSCFAEILSMLADPKGTEKKYVQLHVSADNLPAVRIYQSFGFTLSSSLHTYFIEV